MENETLAENSKRIIDEEDLQVPLPEVNESQSNYDEASLKETTEVIESHNALIEELSQPISILNENVPSSSIADIHNSDTEIIEEDNQLEGQRNSQSVIKLENDSLHKEAQGTAEPESVLSTSNGREQHQLRYEAKPFYPVNKVVSNVNTQEPMTDPPIMQSNVKGKITKTLSNIQLPHSDPALQDEDQKVPEYRQKQEQLSSDTQSPILEPSFSLPRINMVTTDMLGRPRFQPIVPYVWPQDYNMRYFGVPNMQTNMEYATSTENVRTNGIPNIENNQGYYDVSNMVTNLGYNNVVNNETEYYEPAQQYQNYEDPNNIQNQQHNYILCPSTYQDNINANSYELSEYVAQPTDQNTVYHEYIPSGPEPYTPCMANNDAIHIRQPGYTVPPQVVAPQVVLSQRYAGTYNTACEYNPGLLPVYTQMENGQVQICSPIRAQRARSQRSELNRQAFCRPTTSDNNMSTINKNTQRWSRNTRRRHMDQNMTDSIRQNLRYRHLLDEDEIYLIENMELPENQRRNRSSQKTELQHIDKGSQAMILEDYLLIENISIINHIKFKSCTDLLQNKSPNKQDGQLLSRTENEDTYDLKSLTKDQNKHKKATLKTISITNLTESELPKSTLTQTDILDIETPFKVIIPTKFKVQIHRSKSLQTFPKLTENNLTEPINSPKVSSKFIAYESPEPKFIRKSVKFIKLPEEIGNPIITPSEEIKSNYLNTERNFVSSPDTTTTSQNDNKPPQQKSVRFTVPIKIPQENIAPAKPQGIRKCVTFAEANELSPRKILSKKSILVKKSATISEIVKSPQEKSDGNEPQEIRISEATSNLCTLSDRTTGATIEILTDNCAEPVPSTSRTGLEPNPPQTVTIPQEEGDGIPIMPKRKNKSQNCTEPVPSTSRAGLEPNLPQTVTIPQKEGDGIPIMPKRKNRTDNYTEPVPSTSRAGFEPNVPQTVTIPQEEDDGIPIMPKRKNRTDNYTEPVPSTSRAGFEPNVPQTVTIPQEEDDGIQIMPKRKNRTDNYTEPVPSTSQAGLEPNPPNTVTIPQEEDDGIPIMPRRKNRKPGEPAYLTYAAVVSAGQTTPENVVLKRTESPKRKEVVRAVEVNIPPSNTRVPTSYADAASRKIAKKQPVTPRPTIRQSRPIVPIRRNANNLIVLELTLDHQLVPNSLQTNFRYYINRGMRFKILDRQIVLLIFHEERDANEVLQTLCSLGTIVPIARAGERSKLAASTYCHSIARRHKTPSRYSNPES